VPLELISLIFLLCGAVLLGAVAGGNSTAAFAVVLLAAALPMVNARPITWIGLAITVSWTSRLLTVNGLAPRLLDFMDFPLVVAAALVSVVSFLGRGDRLSPSQLRICRWLSLVAVVIAVSWAFNDGSEPLRLVGGWTLALEPFLLLVALLTAPMSKRERRGLLGLTAALLCGQLVFSLWQIAHGAVADSVKGSLFAAGAGHHVSAGGLAIGFFLLVGLRAQRRYVVPYGVVALAVMVTADAKQVLFVLPAALLVLFVSNVRGRAASAVLGGLVTGLAMAAAAGYALLTYQASSAAFDFIDRAATNRTGKVAVADALWKDINSSAPSLVFGLGPGESVSRFSYLTTPGLLKAGSPVSVLGLHPSRGAARYDEIAFAGPFTGESSFTSGQSSGLGILGDYGLTGLAAFAGLIWAVIVAVRREATEGLRAAALASWTLLLPLAVVFDWLEQPPFTLAVMMVTGLALRPRATLDPDSRVSLIAWLSRGRRRRPHARSRRDPRGEPAGHGVEPGRS